MRKTNSLEFTIEYLESIAMGCSNKGDFRNNHSNEYRYVMKMGLSESILSLIPRKKKWDREKLINEAKKYKTRSEWMKSNMSSFNTAIKLGVYDECVKHMGEKKKFGFSVKWTYDKCKETYLRYVTMKDLIKNDKGAYMVAIKNGWHNELSSHLIKYKYQNERKWTLEKIHEVALGCNSIKELSKKNPSAYIRALKNDWIKDITKHMTGGNTKWTVPKLVELLGKHPKKEWNKISPAACRYMRRHKIDLFSEIVSKFS